MELHDIDTLGDTLGDAVAETFLLLVTELDTEELLILGNCSPSPRLGVDWLETRDVCLAPAIPIPSGLMLKPASIGSGLRGGVTVTFALAGDAECHPFRRDGLP